MNVDRVGEEPEEETGMSEENDRQEVDGIPGKYVLMGSNQKPGQKPPGARGCLITFLIIIALFIAVIWYLTPNASYYLTGSSRQNTNHDYAQSNREELETLYYSLTDEINTHIKETIGGEYLGESKVTSPKNSSWTCDNGLRISTTAGHYQRATAEELNNLVEYISTLMEPYGFDHRETLRTTADNYRVVLWNRNGQGKVDISQGAALFYVSIYSPCYAYTKTPTE